jgi:hypothetical protein
VALFVSICTVIAESPFHGEGHRKICARLRTLKGVRTSMRRVLRVMRGASLGCIERFFRTLKEQLVWVRHFSTLDELRQALLDFQETYERE